MLDTAYTVFKRVRGDKLTEGSEGSRAEPRENTPGASAEMHDRMLEHSGISRKMARDLKAVRGVRLKVRINGILLENAAHSLKYLRVYVSPETAKKCLEESKADGIAIGRAAMGDLSIIYRIEKYLNEGILLPEPTLEEKISMLKKHLDFQIDFRGEENGIKFFRKFYPCYIRNIRGGGDYRHRLVTELNYNKIVSILNEILSNAKSE